MILGGMFGGRSDQLPGTSARQHDRGVAIVQLIEGPDLEDRRFILETVERLGEPLRLSRPASNIKKTLSGRQNSAFRAMSGASNVTRVRAKIIES